MPFVLGVFLFFWVVNFIMAESVKEKAAPIKVPTMVELAKSRAKKEKAAQKKSNLPLLAVGVIVLLIIIVFAVLFLVPKYKYSFNISGVDFVSNDYTPSEFFPQFKDNNSFLVIIDVKEGQSNAWVVNAMNLWLIGLNSDGKHVQSLVQMVDFSGAPKSCATNDSNILSSRDIPLSECSSLINDPSKAKVVISLSNEDTVIMSNNRLDVLSSGTTTISQVNYFAIKQMYSDFDKTLALVNERINSIK